jgi:hypothetical protein
MSVRTLRSERSASARFRQERDVDYSQIPGRAFPSRLHVLENQLAPGFSPSLSHQPASHVGCACGSRTRGITGAQCDARVRTLSQNHVVKQQPAPSQRHSGRDTLGLVFAGSERFLGWRGLPGGGSSGLRLQSLGALEAVTYRVQTGDRYQYVRPGSSYPKATGSRTRRDTYRVAN